MTNSPGNVYFLNYRLRRDESYCKEPNINQTPLSYRTSLHSQVSVPFEIHSNCRGVACMRTNAYSRTRPRGGVQNGTSPSTVVGSCAGLAFRGTGSHVQDLRFVVKRSAAMRAQADHHSELSNNSHLSICIQRSLIL